MNNNEPKLLTKFTVSPFSGKNYGKNDSKVNHTTHQPCAICGKGVDKNNTKFEAVVINGGSSWGDDSSDTQDGGYMGTWPIGNDCAKKFAVKE